MRVLIDLTQVPVGRMGAGSYAENVLEQLKDRTRDIELFVVLQSDDPALRAAVPPGTRVFLVPARLFRKLPLRLLLEQIYLPALARTHKIDVIHSLHYSFPFCSGGAQRLVTMHDMTCYLMPQMHPAFKRGYMRLFIATAVRRAEHLVFVSHSARADTEEWFHRVLPNASVIHHGCSRSFRPDLDPGRITEVKRQYGAPNEYILYLGTLEPRKNINSLLKAFSRLAATNKRVRLVIAGKKGWYYQRSFDLVKELAIEEQVSFAGYVDEKDKPYLIAGAKLFVYPSLYEGFGLPVLEAMACGVPTIASHVASLPEVAGDGALLIDPSSVDELASTLEQVYFDPELRSSLRSRGLIQAAKFSWEKSVEELIAVYRELGRKPRGRRAPVVDRR